MASQEEDIPFYLMPVAAVLGLYAAGGFGRTVYAIYCSVSGGANKEPPFAPRGGHRRSTQPKQDDASSGSGTMQVGSAAFVRLLVSWVLAALAYSFVVAKIERAFQAAEYALFDPYEILGISESSSTNTTVIKQAYRQLAKVHHPDKAGGDAKLFQKISKAYDALTDAHSMRNYRLYGHPDGPLSTPAFQMALPAWLLFPEGNIAAAMLLVYLGMIAFLIYFVLQQLRTNKNEAASPDKSKAGAVLDSTNSVSIADLEWLANHLKPDSTHFDVLMAVLTTPELVQWSLQDLARVEKARTERLQQKQQAASADDYDKLFTEGGWDEDDDGDDDNDGGGVPNSRRETRRTYSWKASTRACSVKNGSKVPSPRRESGLRPVSAAWKEKPWTTMATR